MKTMAQRIHQKRVENNLTMDVLAKKLGVSRSTINKWEKAMVTDIKRPYINKLAEIFHCDIKWLMGLDGTKVNVTYHAPDRESVTLSVDEGDDDTPLIGRVALKAKLYEAASNVAPANYEIAIKLLQDLSIEETNKPSYNQQV